MSRPDHPVAPSVRARHVPYGSLVALIAAAATTPAIALAQSAAQSLPPAPPVSPVPTPSLQERLDALEARAARLEAEAAAVRSELAALRDATDSAAPAVPTAVPPPATASAVPLPPAPVQTAAVAAPTAPAGPVSPPPPVAMSAGRPTFTSSDGASRLAVRGLFQLDAASISQDRPAMPDLRRGDAANASDLNSGTNMRRARIGIEGQLAPDWTYGITLEFGGSGVETPELNQAFLEYGGLRPVSGGPPLRVRIGAWATPTGLEDATSNTEALFHERAAVADLVRGMAGGDGRSGIGLFMNGRRWSANAVVTGGGVGVSGQFGEQTGLLLRASTLAYDGGSRSGLVLGISYNAILEPADTDAGIADQRRVRLRERPELRVDGLRLVDTGAIPASGAAAVGLEAGGWFGPLYLAGEYFQIDVDRSGAGLDPGFSGWYLQGAWTLTGETRRWNAASGGIGGIRPARAFDPASGSWGAVEIAARTSLLDLDFEPGALGTAAIPGVSVRGGQQTVTSLGLNWYPTTTIRFTLARQWVEVERLDPENGEVVGTTLFGGAPSVPGNGAQIGQSTESWLLRTQVSF